MDRVQELATEHPEWKNTQPFQAVLEGDMQALAASGDKGLLELIMATHAGMTTNTFAGIVKGWLETARHPTLKKPYTHLVFKPMLELLDYLRANDFKTFIVSGGGMKFMRALGGRGLWNSAGTGGGDDLVSQHLRCVTGNPCSSESRKLILSMTRPASRWGSISISVADRSLPSEILTGDLQMLQWTTMGVEGKRFAGIVHHTDAERELAYDKDSHVGRLDKALIEAKANGWTVVNMKKEWKVIYP